MAEQHLRQDKHGCYYWADAGPTEETVVVPITVARNSDSVTLGPQPALPIVVPPVVAAVEPPKPKRTRNRGPRKVEPQTVTVPPPPIIRG